MLFSALGWKHTCFEHSKLWKRAHWVRRGQASWVCCRRASRWEQLSSPHLLGTAAQQGCWPSSRSAQPLLLCSGDAVTTAHSLSLTYRVLLLPAAGTKEAMEGMLCPRAHRNLQQSKDLEVGHPCSQPAIGPLLQSFPQTGMRNHRRDEQREGCKELG